MEMEGGKWKGNSAWEATTMSHEPLKRGCLGVVDVPAA